MTKTPHSLLSEGSTPPKSPWRPIVITLLSAFVLGAGSCFGFLNTLRFGGGDSGFSSLFMYAFFLCLGVFVGGLLWAVVTAIRNTLKRRTKE